MLQKENKQQCKTFAFQNFTVVWALLCGVVTLLLVATLSPSARQLEARSLAAKSEYWSRPPVIYGHVHIAKTAGTSLNGMLALNFERVCGHKGYSHDFTNFNKRGSQPDIISDRYGEGFDRGRVPFWIMDEEGFEDCDYISQERSAEWWTRFSKWDVPVELHVPCREPIDHLMSLCNYFGHRFRCNLSIELEMRPCLKHMGRYSDELTRTPNLIVKCYSTSKQFTGYYDYVAKMLQRKRITSEYKFRAMNEPRKLDDECIWRPENADLKQRIERTLVESYDYYRFCNRCIGSKDDLLH